MARASLPGYRIRSRGAAWIDVRTARFVLGASPRAHLAIDGAPRHLRLELGDDGAVVRALGGPVAIGGVAVFAAPVHTGVIEAGAATLEIERGAPWDAGAPAAIAGLDAVSPLRQLAVSGLVAAIADRTPLVIEGEAGAGATTAARAVHAARGGVWIEVDASSDVDTLEPRLFGAAMGRLGLAVTSGAGAFAEARGGTLLLERVDALDPSLHTRLVAALDRAPDVAVIATARDLDASDLSEPLYDRLAHRRVWLPPLAAAPEDLHAFALRFAQDAAPHCELPRDLPRILGARRWRGNLTELRAFMTRLVREV